MPTNDDPLGLFSGNSNDDPLDLFPEQKKKPTQNESLLGDTGTALNIGTTVAIPEQVLGVNSFLGKASPLSQVLDTFTPDFLKRKSAEVDDAARAGLQGRRQALQADYTPETQAATQKEFFGEDATWQNLASDGITGVPGKIKALHEQGAFFGDAWSDPRKIYVTAVESLPGTVATMGPTALGARMTYANAIKAGATQEAAQQAAERFAMLAGGASEGVQGAGAGYEATRQKVLAMPLEELARDENFKLALDTVDPSLPMETRLKAARLKAAEGAAMVSAAGSGLFDSVFGALGDRYLGTAAAGGQGAVKAAAKGTLQELPTEAVQSGGEQLSENLGIRNFANAEQDLMAGVGEEAVTGGLAGALTGGVMGGAVGRVASPMDAAVQDWAAAVEGTNFTPEGVQADAAFAMQTGQAPTLAELAARQPQTPEDVLLGIINGEQSDAAEVDAGGDPGQRAVAGGSDGDPLNILGSNDGGSASPAASARSSQQDLPVGAANNGDASVTQDILSLEQERGMAPEAAISQVITSPAIMPMAQQQETSNAEQQGQSPAAPAGNAGGVALGPDHAAVLSRTLGRGARIVTPGQSALPDGVRAGERQAGLRGQAGVDLGRLVGAVSGRKVVFFDGGSKPADGFAIDNDRQFLYLNVDQSVSPVSTAIHEVTHTMRRDAPEAYEGFTGAVRDVVDTGDEALLRFASIYAPKQFVPKLIEQRRAEGETAAEILADLLATSDIQGRDGLLEEFHSDLMGRAAEHKDTWQMVTEEMARQSPNVLRAFLRHIEAMANRIKAAFSGKQGFQHMDKFVLGKDVQELEKNLQVIRRAAAQALGRYAGRSFEQREALFAQRNPGAVRFSEKRPGSDIGHKRTKSGDYVGAPAGMTPAKLGAQAKEGERVGQISWEAMPGKTTGVLPGIFDAPLEQQLEYLVAMDKALRDENGQDLIAKKLGLSVVATAMGPSAWQMNVGAGAQTEVVIATDRDQGNKAISVTPQAKSLLNIYAAIRGYVLAQEAVVWHFPIFDAAKKNANGVQLDFGRDPTHDEVVSLYNTIHAISGRDDWAPAYVPGVGVRVLNFSDVPNVEFHKVIREAAQADGVPDFHFKTFKSEGDYIGNDWGAAPKGEQYKEIIDGQDVKRDARGSGRSDLQGWVESELRSRAERVNQEFAEKYGWGKTRFSPSRSDAARDERTGGRDAEASGSLPEYGQATPGSVSAIGRHYSVQQRSSLDGRYYGTGANGREAERLRAASDPRIKERIYFYVNAGRGVTPEQGVGSHAHDIRLNNLYDANADTWLQADLGRGFADNAAWLNAFESAVIDNGFDGYVSDFGTQRAAVLLGRHNVKPSYAGVNPTTVQGKAEPQTAQPKPQANADKVEAARVLPMGQMTGAEWKRLIPVVVPGVDASMLDDAKAYYKSDVVSAMRGGAKMSPTRLLAPNGEPSNLTEAQWRQVRTPEFKAWFGDWEEFAKQPYGVWADTEGKVSKVVDKNGEPLVLYHGSEEAGFTVFEGERNPRGTVATFFTSSRAIAGTYSGRRAPEADLESEEKSPGIYSVFLNIRNPSEQHFEGANWDGTFPDKYEIEDGFGDRYYAEDGRGVFDLEEAERIAEEIGGTYHDADLAMTTNSVVEEAKRYGHDGAVIREVVDNGSKGDVWAPSDVFVVFEPEQAKSSVGNTGAFDPKNPDIRFSPSRVFFSQLARAFEQAPDRIFGPASQVKAWLASNAAKLQVKKDEIEWTGISDWLDLQGKQRITKQQVLGYLQQNGVQVEEVMKGGTLSGAALDKALTDADFLGFDTLAQARRAYRENPANWDLAGIDTGDTTKYGSYVLPGGENYRELLLTLPGVGANPDAEIEQKVKRAEAMRELQAEFEAAGNPERAASFAAKADALDAQAAELRKLPKPMLSGNYRSSHWTELNILAHVRFNDRTDADGNKVLFIEELQSDWGQDGKKKGFGGPAPASKRPTPEEHDALLRDMRQRANEEVTRRAKGGIDADTVADIVRSQPRSQVAEWAGMTNEWNDLMRRGQEWDAYDRNPPVPTAPFVTKTEGWLDLGLKRMIAYAVEHGYDKIAFVNGEQSAERYDLSKQISRLEWKTTRGEEKGVLLGWDTRGENVLEKELSPVEVEDYVGKEVASRLINAPVDRETVRGRQVRRLSGVDLKVGGEGMKAFYDQIVPQRVREVLKKLGGGKLETVKVGGELSEQWGIYDATDSENQGLVEAHPTRPEAQTAARDNYDNSGIDIRQVPKYGEQLGFTITPEMKEKVAQGQPLFSRNLGATLPDGRIALVLENLDDSNFEAVLQHEALHATLRSLIGEATYTRLMGNLSEQLRLGKGAAWVKAAAAAVPANTPAAHRTEEIAAYAVQQYAEGAKLANPLRLWVKKFLAALRAGILRFAPDGRVKDWAARTVTPATLSKLAIAGLKAKATGKVTPTAPPVTRYSQSATTDRQALRAKARGWIAQNRGWMLGALTRDQLADIYGAAIPEAGEFDHVAQKMDQARNALAERADEIIERWRRLSTEEADRLADVMHEATIEQFDPADPQAAPSGIEQRAIAKAWAALTPEAKALYKEVRDTYEGTLVRMRNGLSKRAERAGTAGKRIAAQIRLEFDRALSKGPYFPLSRFGDLLLIGRSPTGERTVEAFESGTARDVRAAELRRAGYSIKLTAKRDYSAATDAPAADFVGQVLKLIDGTEMDAKQKSALMDGLNQLSIAMLPDQSARKHFAHRKAVPGYNQDAMRAFAASMQHAGHHLARVLHGDELQLTLDGLHKRLAEAKGDADLTEQQQVANELGRRLEYMLAPDTHPVAAALGQVGFVMSLGGSVAAGLVNLTQTPLVTFPWLGAKFGWGAASQALSKAGRDYFAGKWDRWSGFVVKDSPALTADERRAMRELEDAGLVNLSQAHDLAGVANTDRTTSKRAFAVNRAMKVVSWTFHLPEVFNRQVSGLAAYRLARSAGKSHEAAVELAGQTLRRTHFDYSASNRARWMQGNFTRVITMFKSYSQNMTYMLWRNAYLALKSETPEVRREARRMFLGVGAMHFAAAGSLGLPLGVFGISPLLGLLAMGMGDDDEPFDWQTEYRNWLADTFGKAGGEAIAKGPARLLVDVDIASRVGLGDLWIRPPQGEHEGRDLVEAWMLTLAGPVAGYVGNLGTAAQAFNEGQFSRGVEALVPKFIRDPLKAMRYEREGVTSWKGDDLGVNLDGGDLFAQAIGFQPAALAEMYEGRAAVKGREARLQNRASELRRVWVEASLAGDQGMRAEVLDQVKAFNEKNPAMRITGQSLRQAVATKRRNARQIEDGIYLTKKRESLREAGRFANVQRNGNEE